MTREIQLELLLGKPVQDSTGKTIGLIQEVYAEQQGDEWVILEYLLGPAAILERLSAWRIGQAILPLLSARRTPSGYRIPWDKIDLTDPKKPRLLCSLDELETL